MTTRGHVIEIHDHTIILEAFLIYL